MFRLLTSRPTLALSATTAALAGVLGAAALTAAPARAQPAAATAKTTTQNTAATVEVFAPRPADRAAIGGAGFLIDLAAKFRVPLQRTGFTLGPNSTGLQLTGPGVHNNAPSFAGTFGKGPDDRFPGLIVLLSSTQTSRPDGSSTGFSGPGQNLANLFNVTALTDRNGPRTELWTTWIAGAPSFGRNVHSVAYVAIAADKNRDGVFNDAPDTVPDANRDGRVDAKDLTAYGVASNIVARRFYIRD